MKNQCGTPGQRDFVCNGKGRVARIGRARDRSPNHEVVCPGANRLQPASPRETDRLPTRSLAARPAQQSGTRPRRPAESPAPHAPKRPPHPAPPAWQALPAQAPRDPGRAADPDAAQSRRVMAGQNRHAQQRGRLFRPATASVAARIISAPPNVCRVTSRTPGSSAAAATLPATVFGISWNFRSRNTPKPSLAIFSTARGPSAVNSWLPILNMPAAPRSRRAKTQAGPRRSTSRATISCGDPRRGVEGTLSSSSRTLAVPRWSNPSSRAT